MIIAARELPELRNELFSHPEMPGIFGNLYESHCEILAKNDGSLTGPVDEYVYWAGLVLRDAPLHYVDQRFSQLVGAAAPSMPPSPLALHDLPTPRGFMYFSEPMLDGRSQRPAHWIALWSLFDNQDHSKLNIGAIVWWLVDRETKWIRSGLAEAAKAKYMNSDTEAWAMREMLPRFCPSVMCQVTFGNTSWSESLIDPPLGHPNWILRYLFTTWHIQRQRLTTTRLVRPQRAAARRLARAGDTTDHTVRVITLRTPDPPPTGTGSSHEYHHQWVVRGHWRQHWYPTISDHRPVWIAPHLKGPEGAPLLGGEKVYNWLR